MKVTIYLPKGLYSSIKERAKKEGRSLSNFIAHTLETVLGQ